MVADLQRLDAEVRQRCLAALALVELALVELALRAGFARRFAELIDRLRRVVRHEHVPPDGNRSTKNPPAVPRNFVGRAKRRFGSFDPRSYFHAFVALETFVASMRPERGFLASVESAMAGNETYRTGMLNPSPY